jgi:hypothetical protein
MNVAERSLRIPADSVVLDADLAVPEPATAVVLFAHGSGSSRPSPRNRFVARELQHARGDHAGAHARPALAPPTAGAVL